MRSLSLVAFLASLGCGADPKPDDSNPVGDTSPPADDTSPNDTAAPAPCDLAKPGAPRTALPESVVTIANAGVATLTADTVWTLDGIVRVPADVTLRIEPCTRVEGTGTGTLVVSRGGRIEAVGRADAPILFTSGEAAPAPGDWGGVYLLGSATNYRGTDLTIEGLAASDVYGGTDDAHDCGEIAYVQIAYPGAELVDAEEAKGLVLASCGTDTDVEQVAITGAVGDGLQLFGGRVDVRRVVVDGPGDDAVDVDQGTRGTLTEVLVRHDRPNGADPNGLEWDSDPSSTDPPVTDLAASRVTLCGEIASTTGAVLRENVRGSLNDVVVAGFRLGFDARGPFGTPASPSVTLNELVLFGQGTAAVDPDADDDDEGFDEGAWVSGSPGFSSDEPWTLADCLEPSGPAAAVTSQRIGAFALDGEWASWVDFSLR